MTREGAAGALSPVSATSDIASTPLSGPARTPVSAEQDPKARPKEAGSGAEPSKPVLSPTAGTPPKEAGTPVTAQERVAPAVVDPATFLQFPPADDSPPSNELVLKTAMLPPNDQLDENGQPLRVQARVTYENMIVRYGYWKNLRVQAVAHCLVALLMYIYRGHGEEILRLTEFDKTSNDQHVHCCCQEAASKTAHLKDIGDKLRLDNVTNVFLYLALLVATLTAPFWERFIGRRRVLLSATIAAIPASLLLMFAHLHFLHQISAFVLDLCSMLTILIITSSLVEMYPYELRYQAGYILVSTMSFTVPLSALHFLTGFSMTKLSLLTAAASLGAALIVKFVIKESICHLNIRNEVNVIEAIVRKQEDRLLHSDRQEGSKAYHRAVAKKIFEDLVYLDQDELILSKFFKRIWKSFTMIEIFLAFLQAISLGIHDYESNHFINELFTYPQTMSMDRIFGYVLGSLIQLFARKCHRTKVICSLLAAQLINSAARNAFVSYDPSIRCASVEVVKDQFFHLSFLFGISATGIWIAAVMTILLHFLESTPSILRPFSIVMIYLPVKVASLIARRAFADSKSNSLSILVPIFCYHVLVIVLTMLRTRSPLPFALYLYDLMTPAQRAQTSDTSGNEKTRPIMEATAMAPSLRSRKEGAGSNRPAVDSTKQTRSIMV